MTITYTNRANCIRAARKALDANALPGKDFTIGTTADGKFFWSEGAAPKTSAVALAVADTAVVADTAADDELAQAAPTDEQLLTDVDPDKPEPSIAAGIDALDALLADAKAGVLDQPVAAKPRRQAKAPAPKGPSARQQAQAAREALLASGQLPPRLVIQSPQNQSYQKRADALLALAEAGKLKDLAHAEIAGCNTYSKMLVRYRDELVTALKARQPAKPAKAKTHAAHATAH